MPEATRAPVDISTPAPATPSIFSMHRPAFGAPRFHMDENAGGSPGSAGPDTVVVAPADTGGDLSISQAARALQAARRRPEPAAAVEPEPAPATEELAQASDDPAEPAPVEEPEGTEPAPPVAPPIERPRSWSKDDEDDWNALPRDRQEKIAKREQERDRAIRQGQNETAEKLKGLTVKEQEAEQARTQYEERAKGALKVLEREQLRDFPDIKTMDDVKNLLTTDPLRYLQWDAHQKEMVAATMAVQESEKRTAETRQTEWAQHVQAENAKAAEVIPELADPEKGPALQKRAAERLIDLGFSPNELNDLAAGKSKISIYDHRFQRLISSDLKLTDLQATMQKAKAAAAVAAAKPVPPVQRPGVTQPRGAVESTIVKGLDTKLNTSGSLKDALALVTARRNARR